MVEVREGQIWVYGGDSAWARGDHIKIQRLRNKTCQLYNITRSELGNTQYSIFKFEDQSKWQLLVTKCPECDTNDVADGDFLCKACRETVPISGRIIVTVDEDAEIVTFQYSAGKLILAAHGMIEIESKDAPKAFNLALKRFLDTDS